MMISPTGITINFGGTHGGAGDSRPVVARISGFATQGDLPIVHDLVVPAGESVEQQLPKGLYNVQLTLPSGRIIQRNVTIDVDTNEAYTFFEDFAAGSGFSLQESVGRSDGAILAEATTSSGNTSEADYRKARASVERRNKRASKAGAKSFSARAISMPTAPEHSRLGQRAGKVDLFGVGAPGSSGWRETDPVEQHGTSALWRLSNDTIDPPNRMTRRWARIELPSGGVEIASVPLPWMCLSTGTYIPVDLLVDPSRREGASTTVAVKDAQLAGLLAFLDRGQASSAGPLLAELEQANVIEQTIYDKMSNPLAACAAAYVGLAVYPPNEREQWDNWLGNCMRRFPDVPDAGIVHARRLMLRPTGSEDNVLAAEALLKACNAGPPFFSAGVLLLREMLTLLSPDFESLKSHVERAAVLAGRVDESQAFTVFRFASAKVHSA